MTQIVERLKAKTPMFWKKVQRIGIVAGVIGGVIMTAPISLPASIVAVGGYLVTAGGITAALSQLTKEDHNSDNQ